jgi:hypothetical protein
MDHLKPTLMGRLSSFLVEPAGRPRKTVVHDLTGLRRGNSFRRTFCFKELDGDPVDLTGSVLLSVIEASAVRIVTSTVDGSPVSRCSCGFIAESSTALLAEWITPRDRSEP